MGCSVLPWNWHTGLSPAGPRIVDVHGSARRGIARDAQCQLAAWGVSRQVGWNALLAGVDFFRASFSNGPSAAVPLRGWPREDTARWTGPQRAAPSPSSPDPPRS